MAAQDARSESADILTVGHSTHTLDELTGRLLRHGVRLLVDVRAHPGSRRMPHFGREPLGRALAAEGVGYLHLPELGGRRRPLEDSPNGGWRKATFRGYADHMGTAEFDAGRARLEEAARQRRTAVMCAEILWWRCHRRLVADALTVRGWSVGHIGPGGELVPHALPSFAAVEGRRVVYPPVQTALDA